MKKELILIFSIILLSSQALAFEFCEDGTIGENNLRLISVNDMLKENTKEWVWESSQKIELEARVENKDDGSNDYKLEAIFKDKDKTIRIATDSNDLEKEFSLSSGERKSISLEFEVEEDLDPEKYDLYIKFYKESNEDEECTENSEEKITIEKIELCENGKVDENDLEIKYIKDEKNENENEWEWTPMDNIEISMDLENKDYSKRDFTTELIFLNEDKEEVSLADNSKDLIKEENIDEDNSEEMNFKFQLRPDIEEGKYTLYAKAYDSEDEEICTSLKAEKSSSPIAIQVNRLERKVIITSVEGPTNLETSSVAEYKATITNLGNEDEEKALGIIYNRQLEILERVEIDGLNSGEEKEITFDITIPENASESKYALLFSTEYEYKESQDIFKKASDESDDIKYFATVTKKEIEETTEPIQEKNQTSQTNETANQTNESEQITTPSTTITGNAIGTHKESPNWILIILLIVLLITGITLFIKKPKTKKPEKIEPPKVIRRYTAKL